MGYMNWEIPLRTKTAREYIAGAYDTIRQIRMFEAIAQNEQYLEWMRKHYSDLVSISMDFTNPRELREEAAIRASEVRGLVLVIADALNYGEKLRDPESEPGRELRRRFEETRSEYLRMKQREGENR